MDINKRNRTELKSYFVKNAIPTASNFTDLIEGALNQKDDGIVKLPGDPLSIEAAGDATSLKKAINFYRNFSDANPDWTINLNPRSNPNDASTGKLGFNISDGEGNSRLFIDRDTGNVGVGTTTPGAKLEVARGAIRPASGNSETAGIMFPKDLGGGGGDAAWIRYYAREGEKTTFEIGTANDGDDHIALIASGNVGIGIASPGEKLHVSRGKIQLDGNQQIKFTDTDTSNNLKVQLYSGYGLGINASTLFYAANGRHSWRDNNGTKRDGMALTTGADGGLTVMGTGNSSFVGNVGIGTPRPDAKLQVDNPHAAASQALIISNSNTGFAADEGVYQSYYVGATTGNEMARILAANKTARVLSHGYLAFYTRNADQVIEKVRIDNTGNVGIGTPNPQTKLQVVGGISASGNETTHSQGAYLEWNKDSNSGITYLLNQKGLGVGGIIFGEVDAGNSVTQRMRIDANGNVGIGTTTSSPGAKLQVAGGAIMPAPGNAETAGIMFPKDPFGGSGDAAWIRYYARQGEAMTFEIGTSNDADDHIAFMASGNVGIGINAPEKRLHIEAGELRVRSSHNNTTPDIGAFYAQNLTQGVGIGYNRIQAIGSNPTQDINMIAKGNAGVFLRTGGDRFAVMQGDGNLVVYDSAGRALWNAGTSISDVRLKENIYTIDNALAKVLQLRGVSFSWKDKKIGTDEEIGLVAQEVETIVPYLVHSVDQKTKMIRYEKCVPLLVEAIKEQQARIDQLRDEIKLLKA